MGERLSLEHGEHGVVAHYYHLGSFMYGLVHTGPVYNSLIMKCFENVRLLGKHLIKPVKECLSGDQLSDQVRSRVAFSACSNLRRLATLHSRCFNFQELWKIGQFQQDERGIQAAQAFPQAHT